MFRVLLANGLALLFVATVSGVARSAADDVANRLDDGVGGGREVLAQLARDRSGQPDGRESLDALRSDPVSSAIDSSIAAIPSITVQPESQSVTVGHTATLSLSAAGSGLSYQWYVGGQPVDGSAAPTGPALTLDAIDAKRAGIYDCLVTNSAGRSMLSAPVVVGVLPPAGERTAGSVRTRPEWQNIHHRNGNIYDQFLLTGDVGTFTADSGQIARMSFLDLENNIVQVEISGAGAATVLLDRATGPITPALYNQSGILYMQGAATVILAGADATTNLSIYSVGRTTNPGVTRAGVTYDGWAHVGVVGVVSVDGNIGELHLGNDLFAAERGFAGILAPNVAGLTQMPVMVHDIAAAQEASPCLAFAPDGRIQIKIAGGDLTQLDGNPILVSGLSQVMMGAGQGSSGQAAPARACRGRLIDENEIDVTAALVVGP